MYIKVLIFIFSFFVYFNTASSDDLKIAYVDMNIIINQSNAGINVTKQLKVLNDNNIKKFKQKESQIAKEEKDLLKKKNILPKEEFQKKVKILQKNVVNFKKNINISRKELSSKKLTATTKILNVLNPILSEYSSKNSISLILQKKNIVIGKSELDITNEILKLVNTKIKTVKLN